jgi:hypothetical protein
MHEYTVDADRRFVRVRLWGALTPGDIHTAAEELRGDARVGQDFSELIDLRELTSVKAIGSEDVRALATAALDPSSKRAFVTDDSATFGLARMFATLRTLKDSREQVGVFRTIEEAQDWLGL